ncbi:MAG: hypothetical protein AAGK23_00945 [Pseudomonadota bacterium]
MDYLFGYWVPSVLMGTGIAIDVILATIVQFNDERLSFRNWTLPVTITHIVFPALGYYSFYIGGSAGAVMLSLFGLAGGLFLALFLYELTCEWLDIEPKFGIAAWSLRQVEKVLGISADRVEEKHRRRELLSPQERIVLILAVSWDALFSGPAKSAQAESGQWSDSQVVYSFIIAGLVVTIASQLAMFLRKFVAPGADTEEKKWVERVVLGRYLEVLIIGAFGIMSLWNAGHQIWGLASLWPSLVLSAYAWGVFFFVYKERIQGSAREAFEF